MKKYSKINNYHNYLNESQEDNVTQICCLHLFNKQAKLFYSEFKIVSFRYKPYLIPKFNIDNQ